MKILFLSHYYYPQVGGIESNSELLAAAFTAAGHEVHLLTWSPDNTNRAFPYRITRNPRTRQLLQAHQWADLVFENNPCFRLGWPGMLYKRPTVTVINTWITRADGTTSLRDKIKIKGWLGRSTHVIAVSNAIRKACWPAAVVIRNPYRAEDFALDPSVQRDADFVFLGRLVSDKGANQAIEAIYRIRQILQDKGIAGPYPCLTIIGDGPEKQNLEQQVAGLSLKDEVVFTGALKGGPLRKMLNRHRYILVPSAWEEPFGNVVLEGMACGCLPIGSDGGGLPEAIGKAGLTFKRNDIDSLVNCIRRVMEDPALDQFLRDAAPPHLEEHHPHKVATKYLQAIETAFNSKKHQYGNRTTSARPTEAQQGTA
ncbi:MAG: glycosyltransferase family 4 protein [Niastella sp.]|uniref:glycosyltransferase family 4 protein n=1 Tax=Niastella sp. TaxID=1869183 RepID=UPI00389ABD69